MQLFYLPQLSEDQKEIVFTKDESRHLVQVLRKAEGDKVSVTDGNGLTAELEITRAHPKASRAHLVAARRSPRPSPSIHLAVAPTKMNERFEWFLEKATEIGVNTVTPIICDRSERKHIKLDRYQRIMDSAAKQSLKSHFPNIEPLMSFSDFINRPLVGGGYIAHCGPGEKEELFACLRSDQQVLILIGPEGDFSPEEVETALVSGFVPISLGSERLRTETAAVVATYSAVLRTRLLKD